MSYTPENSALKAGRLELAVALVTLAFLVAVAFQTSQLVRERSNMVAIFTNQETPMQETLGLRQKVNQLAGDTAQLAQSGDAAAKQVVDDLGRQHVVLKPPVAPPATQ